jgi:hypothetical protein
MRGVENETEDEFAKAMLAADYRTRAISLEVALGRIKSDHNAFASLIAFTWGPSTRDGESVVAIQLRQPLEDSHLALSWAGGRRAKEGIKREPSELAAWETFGPLHDWDDERKRQFLLHAFADVLDRLRKAAEKAALQLSA